MLAQVELLSISFNQYTECVKQRQRKLLHIYEYDLNNAELQHGTYF